MRLIIIDGLDGVGKDTHAELIKKRYEEKGEKVVVRSHPATDNYFGIKTKKALLGQGKIDKIKASVFYMFDVLRSIRKYYGKKDIDTLIMVRYLVGTAYLPSKLAKFGYDFLDKWNTAQRYRSVRYPTKLTKFAFHLVQGFIDPIGNGIEWSARAGLAVKAIKPTSKLAISARELGVSWN